MEASPAEQTPIEKIEWLELFFDLVVVVCLALLAEQLHADPTTAGLAKFVLVFVAVWLTWTSFVLYANVAEETTRIATLLAGAALIGLMTATIPELDERANWFALAYVLARVISTRASIQTGRLLLSWPAAQANGTLAIWIGSLFAHEPAKYWIWAVALAIELAFAVFRGSADPESTGRRLESINARLAEHRERGRGDQPDLEIAPLRADHLSERLGLFMIIVLGEGVTELIRSASEAEWARGLLGASVAGFVLFAGLWSLTFTYGFSGAPGARLTDDRDLRPALLTHLLTTAAIVALASALGELLLHHRDVPETFWRWVACGALALYFAITAVNATFADASPHWVTRFGLPAVVAAVAAGALLTGVNGGRMLAILMLIVIWQGAFGRRERGGRRGAKQRGRSGSTPEDGRLDPGVD